LAAALLALVLAALFAERRRSEAALEQGRERLRLALDGAELGAFSADFATDRLECDARAAQIHGQNVPPTTMKESRRFIHPDDLARVDAALAEAKRAGGVWNAEYRVVPPPNHPHAGETRWVAVESSVMRDLQGAPLGLLGVTRDITERKRAEQALSERNVQLALAGKAGLVATFAYDVKTDRVQISEGYAAIYGFPEGTTEIARSQWRALVLPSDLEQLENLRSQAFADRQREYGREYRIILPDRGVRWIETRSFASYDGEGRPQRVVGVNIDITERKRAEEAGKILNAELDHRVKNALATVTAVISHTQQGTRSVADFAAALEGRIRSMAATHELLSSRRWQGLSLTELIRRELAPYAASNNTEINGPTVLLKPEAGQALAMVLHELATNAAKYGALSTRKGRVMIRWNRRLNGHPLSNLALEWREVGGPQVDAPGKFSYGSSTIRDLIPYEFGGTVDFVFAPEGVRCRFELPANWLTDADDPTEAVAVAAR